MQIILPDEVKNILKKIEDAGYEGFVVGGAVRDLLLGKPVHDWDFTTNATPEQIQEVFDDSYYNNKFGTVGIPSASEEFGPHEITTFRTEQNYKDNRRPEKVEWGKTLEEDLLRRDFTINAMALRCTDGKINKCEIVDPYNGQKDIKSKLVRAVGDPHERFGEDALRLMRAVRFATQLGFKIEKNTLSAIQTQAPLIQKISKERVRDELMLIVAAPKADEGIILLRETGLLQEILPELEKTFGVEQKSPGRHHIYDVGTHCVMSLKFCKSDDPVTRFATLIHDIGKPQTFKVLDSGTITFYNHEVVGARIAKSIAQRLRFSKADSDKLWRLVRWHQFSVNENQTDSAIRRFIKKVSIEYVDDMLALRTGDRLGGGAAETSWRLEEFKSRLVEVQKQPFSVHDLKIDGSDVMKVLDIKPGPRVGQILNQIFKKVEEKQIENEREILLEILKTF